MSTPRKYKHKTLDDYHALAAMRGFLFVGELPNRVHDKALWQCPNGHQWLARYAHIGQGKGCPHCSIHAQRTASDYASVGIDRGITWIGELPTNAHTVTRWKCAQGHEFTSRYNSIRDGRGCPKCANQQIGNSTRSPVSKYHEIAQANGFEWVGEQPRSMHTKTLWRCANGHMWEATASNIRMGNGCPECIAYVGGTQVSKPQSAIADMFGGQLNVRTGRSSIDVVFEYAGYTVACEYDGWYFHAHRTDKDVERSKQLIRMGYKVIRVLSNRLAPTREQMQSAIDRIVSGEDLAYVILDDWGKGTTLKNASSIPITGISKS